MALRSNASTTSLMNDARSPSGNHSRMSGGNNNRWSCEYGRKRWLMSHTLLARAPLTQHFQSDRLLACDELTAESLDLLHCVLLWHTGPLDAEDEVVHAEKLGVSVDVRAALVRRADDEPIPREVVERNGEALAFRHRLVEAPVGVGAVLRLEIGFRF